jgi:outer membrane receptor protein involved in Fe transport
MSNCSTRTVALVTAVLIALCAGAASAQELRGRIVGTVTDNTGAVLPGVSVTASGPALIQPQVTNTGPDGTYRFPALPSGLYTLTFQIGGFQTAKREAIRVLLNTTLTVDASMQLAGVQETVTIQGESPTVDVKTTTIGTSFTKEMLTDIPNARDVWAVMSQAPGFQMTGYDVGGSHTGTQTGFQVFGFNTQHKTLLEGINVTESTDANAGYFDFGSFEEIQMGGAGNMGEMAGPGGFLNITTKSGGDKFSGMVYFDYENDSTISDNVPGALKTSGGVGEGGFKAPSGGLARGNPITKQYDFNVGLGGPIVKGKLWFYAGYRDNNQYKTILGLPDKAQSQLVNYTGKLTYQINPKNQVIGFFNQRTKLQTLRDLSLAIPTEAAYYQASKNRPFKLEWTSILSDRLFLDLQGAFWGNYFPLYHQATKSRSVEGAPIGRFERTTEQYSGAQDYYHDRITEKPQASGTLSYFKDGWAGTHSFKAGFEAYRERRTFHRFQPGNIFYWDRNGLPEEVDVYNTPNAGINDTNLFDVYLQDGWSVTRRLTLNIGGRFDHYRIGWPEQSFTPEQTAYFAKVSTPATTVATFNSISPRLGFAWDLTGKGKTVWKAFFGRFYYNPSTEIGDLENPVGQAAIRYQFTPCAAGQTSGCDLNGNRQVDGPQELGRQLRTVGGAGFVRVDRDLKHAYGPEISTNLEHELMPNLSVRGSYVYKGLRNGWVEVDLARVNAYTVPFTFVDPGPDNIRGSADDQALNLFDLRPGTPSDRVFTNPGRIPGVPALEADYHTVEFALNRRFKDKWMLLTSFERTWADDFRATTVGTGSLNVLRQAPVGTTSTTFWRPNQRRFGREKSTYWNYKLLGRYEFPLQISVAASYKLQSGYNWARNISVPLPVAGSETVLAERIDANRAPNVHILDFRLEKSFKINNRFGRVTGMLDVFNALNADVVTNARVTTGPRYKEVIGLLDPRIFRFGVRYEF